MPQVVDPIAGTEHGTRVAVFAVPDRFLTAHGGTVAGGAGYEPLCHDDCCHVPTVTHGLRYRKYGTRTR